MTIDVYVVVHNEQEILPWFLRWYGFARTIYVYDDQSTDNTRLIAGACNKVVLRDFPGEPGHISQVALANFKNTCWRNSDADWVIVCDADEFLYHSDLVQELTRLYEAGVTMPYVAGYEMVGSAGLPVDDGRQLSEHIVNGVASEMFNKSVVFRPGKVSPNYFVGCHACKPSGQVVRGGRLSLLHYNFLGLDHIVGRWESARARVSDFDREKYKRYDWSEDRLRRHLGALQGQARTIVG